MSSNQHSPAPADDQRPYKRARQAKDLDDGLRPYDPAPSSSARIPDLDPSGDGGKKNRKRPLSCGECRRLKLKCDRVFPCQSCCKRGCAEICPEGALTGGKGSRFILANTEQLHDKIKTMSDRIRQLEDALQTVYSQVSHTPHPLLSDDLLHIKTSSELFGVGRDGLANHMNGDNSRRGDDDDGPSGSSVAPGDIEDPNTIIPPLQEPMHFPGVPDEIVRISNAFPCSLSRSHDLNPRIRIQIRDMLPSQSEAEYLVDQARLNAFWLLHIDPREGFMPNLVHSIYNKSVQGVLPHRLSLFFMILTIGATVDVKYEGDYRQRAEKFHHLARAALCEVSVIDDPSFDCIDSLYYMLWYWVVYSDHKKAMEYAWGIMGLLIRMAHSLGLNRDGVRSKVIPEELDKRRAMYWNIIMVDARLATMLRRPPSICFQYVDVQYPMCAAVDDSPTNVVNALYHQWRLKFLAEQLLPILDLVVRPQEPAYIEILKRDAAVRDFELPNELRIVDNDGIAPAHPIGMQQVWAAFTIETGLLQLHRSFFTQAVNAPDTFTATHKYAPSILATYISARNYLWALQVCYAWEPNSVRASLIWSNGFSSVVALCLLVRSAPHSPFAVQALVEVDKALQLFNTVGDKSPVVAKAMVSLESLVSIAHDRYTRWRDTSLDPRHVTDAFYGMSLHGDPASILEGGPLSPFHNAHPSLVMYLREPHEEKGHKGPIPPVRASATVHTNSTGMQSYSTSAERTGGGYDGYSGSSSSESATAQWVNNAFLDSTWMTWF